MKVKPESILQQINAKHNSSIKMAQLRNCLAFMRKKKCGGKVTISVGELEHWCNQLMKIPEDEHEPFIVNTNFIYADEDEEAENFDENQ